MSHIDLKHVARLARLHLSEEETRFLETQLAQILSFVEKLNEVKGLEKVEPTSHPLALSNVFREDKAVPSLDIEAFLKHSPQSKGRFFQVPKIIPSPVSSIAEQSVHSMDETGDGIIEDKA